MDSFRFFSLDIHCDYRVTAFCGYITYSTTFFAYKGSNFIIIGSRIPIYCYFSISYRAIGVIYYIPGSREA